MRESGWGEAVDAIQDANNLVYVTDVHHGVLVDWVLISGLTKEEAALIQPGYEPPLFDLTLDEVSATFQLLAEVKRWMDDEYRPQGYNVGWNCGAVGGQDVMHAHMHVIPRFEHEPYAGRGTRYWLKQESNRWR